MRIFQLSIILSIIACGISLAAEPDMIVMQNGESLNVYNLEFTSTSVYYPLTEDADANFNKLLKENILIIKKADGTKIDPSNDSDYNKQANAPHPDNLREEAIVNSYDYQVDKKGNVTVKIGDANIMTLLVDEPRRQLKIIKSNIKEPTLLIPEYVMIGSEKYTITEIGDGCFKRKGKISNILFPKTLKAIGIAAFSRCTGLKKIILPENIDRIGRDAFYLCGNHSADNFIELYLPSNIKDIGEDAFRAIGKRTSPRGFYQGFLSGLPSFIDTDNCTDFGIDDNAVESYEKRNKIQ